MMSKAGKKSSSSNSMYEAPLGYKIEDVRPAGGIKKFQSAAYSNMEMSLADCWGSAPASPIGFEGYEKRLEITFSDAPVFADPCGRGLRALSRQQIDSFLDLARCTIVSQLLNKQFDSYVLSESSLFVYSHKVVIKTCGTTKLLLSIPRILELAAELSLPLLSAKYSRGTFIFPGAQPAPHRSFSEEVSVLNGFFGGLKSGGNAYVMGDAFRPKKMWHVYYATEEPEQPMVTLEMCMTGLDAGKAAVFFKNSANGGCSSAKEMTKVSGISAIIPEMEICDFDFDPCGYSMNGVCGPAASTIHVTPEEGFSYASYEAMNFNPGSLVYSDLIERVLSCFRPSDFSVAVTIFGGHGFAKSWAGGAEAGSSYVLEDVVEQELPGGGLLMYQSFSAVAPGAVSPRSTLDDGWSSDGMEAAAQGEDTCIWGVEKKVAVKGVAAA
ncbi:S-adenosylmethionine decarboxylase proenzyme isoform X2 [Triticum aestivum]|nr:S-adenosylmethionine decarboxylase proenzyme-like isoform X2 [Triticum aestivum]